MRFTIVGLSHKTAPVDLREQVAVSRDDHAALLQALCESDAVAEAMLVSTCNRVELYAVPAGDERADAALEASIVALARADVRRSELEPHLYTRAGRDAVHHLFRVAASLDSMVVGEPQVLGQVKDAASVARESGTVGPILSHVTDRAFSTAKDVRTHTGIARAIVSMGSVAVDLARRIFAKLSDCRVLLVGAGEMGETTARSLVAAGASKVYVTNRSYDRAVALADKYGWRARQFAELGELLGQVDVVISSTGAPRPIITASMIKAAIPARKYRPLFMVDIAVPRDVEASVSKFETVYLYNVDDLESISRANMAGREREAADAELRVSGALDEVEGWFSGLAVKPTLAAIRKRADAVARDELARTLSKRLSHLGDDERRALDKMVGAMVSKLLHPTMSALRNGAGRAGGPDLVTAARVLHGLDTNRKPDQGDA